jgi:hypothetical protein
VAAIDVNSLHPPRSEIDHVEEVVVAALAAAEETR